MKVKHLKKLMLLGSTVLGLCLPAIPAGAQVHVQVQLPPLIQFSSPPEMVVLPDTNVYVVPDSNEEIFFYGGFWWRPWQGHWYRSRHYDQGWGYYSSTPSFYRQVPQDWRPNYQNHQWRGQPWNHERMNHQRVEQNWNTWQKNRYWDKHPQVQRPQQHVQQHQARPPEHPAQQHQARQSGHHGQQGDKKDK